MHATHYARVAHNVAYHIRGHTFFVEDGIETNNVFEANLAINTQCSEVRAVWGASAFGFCCLVLLLLFVLCGAPSLQYVLGRPQLLRDGASCCA